jgi:hypothetical protein
MEIVFKTIMSVIMLNNEFHLLFPHVFNIKFNEWAKSQFKSPVQCILLDDWYLNNYNGHSFSLYINSDKTQTMHKLLCIKAGPTWLVQWKYLFDPIKEDITVVTSTCAQSIPKYEESTSIEVWTETLLQFLREILHRSILSFQTHNSEKMECT